MSSSTFRALRILDEMARSARPLGVTEIARALSLPAGTVFRSIDALVRAGLVARYRASARYVTGPASERLHRSAIARFPAREVCLPYLRQLASISGEAVSLHVRIGWYEVRICSVPGTGEITTRPEAGEARILNESPAGKAILACLPKAELAACCSWSRRSVRARATIFDSPAPGGRVQSGAADGDVIAFPIRLPDRAIAAITIDGPVPLSSPDQLKACRQVVVNIETLASAQPWLFANPFAHLDPGSFTL